MDYRDDSIGLVADNGEVPVTPGASLRYLRHRAGKSMAELADFLGCSVVQVSAIETEVVSPLGDGPTDIVATFHGNHAAPVRWRYEADGSVRSSACIKDRVITEGCLAEATKAMGIEVRDEAENYKTGESHG